MQTFGRAIVFANHDEAKKAEALFNKMQTEIRSCQSRDQLRGWMTANKDRILIQPKPDATEAEKAAFYQRLGRPAKAEDYDFKEIKFPDGSELDDGFTAMLRGAAFKAVSRHRGCPPNLF